jgi:hypothetical protein
MRTGLVLGDYLTRDDVLEIVREMIDSPEAPHWLRVVEVDGTRETVVESDIGLTWKVFGDEAARPLIAETLHYFLNRERQMAEWMPAIQSDKVYKSWNAHHRRVHELVRRFIDREGLVGDADFFDELRELVAQTYELLVAGRRSSLLDRRRDAVQIQDLGLLDSMLKPLRRSMPST